MEAELLSANFYLRKTAGYKQMQRPKRTGEVKGKLY